LNQQEVRQYVEKYAAAFEAHIMESHPAYLSITLTKEMDKDIGNRPFYWSWVEKMNLPIQPLTLTFYFDPEQPPQGVRGEHLHFGSGRLQQIFESTRKHGRFVCLYEDNPSLKRPQLSARRSHPLTPWLNLNLKISFICDKKRDFILYLGINLHQPRIVHDFYSFLNRLSLTPSIPDYFYTLERRISLEEAVGLANDEVQKIIHREEHTWAEQARERLAEELEILEAYYEQMKTEKKDEDEKEEAEEPAENESAGEAEPAETATPAAAAEQLVQDISQASVTLEEHRTSGGRILDFLRMNSIPVTPREQIDQSEWKKSTPEEEKQRRMDELKWQYEPRIEVQLINGGLFYLYNIPPTFH